MLMSVTTGLRLCLFVFLGWLPFVQAQPAATPQSALPVEVVTVEWQDYARPVRFSGVLENKSEQNLAFKISGLVRKVLANEGQWVKEGQLLAALDLEEIDAQVAKAESVLANAERNLARFQSLQGSDALSVEQLQTAETQADVARSDLTVARFNQRHAVIRAPADGRILKRVIENNEMVAPGTPAFLFAPRQSGWVLRGGVSDRDIVRLSLEDQAVVQFDAFPGQSFPARISELAARADQSQTFGVELQVLEQGSQPLLAGFVGHASITPVHTRPVILLPPAVMVRAFRSEQARQLGMQSEVEVFVVNAQQQAELRRLPLLALESGQLVITGGLEEGEQVVVAGAAYLSPGRAVSVVQQRGH